MDARGHGRVLFASDPSGDIATIKIVEWTSRNCYSIDKEIEILRKVTSLAGKSDDYKRVLRVVEIIYSNDQNFSSNTAFDNIAIVLKPMTPQTIGNLVRTRSKG